MEGTNAQNFSSVCRLCLSEDESFISVFDENYTSLPQRIADCVNVQVHESDKMTTMICKACLAKVEDWYDFKKCCEDSQSKLRVWINGHERIDLVDITIKEERDDSSIDDPMQVLETSMCIKSEPIASVYLDETEVDVVGISELSPDSSMSVSAVDQMDSLLVPTLECPASVHGMNAPFYNKNNFINGLHKTNDLSVRKGILQISDLGTKCRVCGKTLSNVYNRFRHERTVHNLERELPVTHFMSNSDRTDDCETDSSEESSNVTLEQFAASLQLVQRNSVRPVSEKQFIEFNQKIHNMMASGTCECCNLVYSSTAALFEHLSKQMSLEPYTCFMCCITFPDESQFVEHAHQNFCEQRATLLESADCSFKVYQHYECVECKAFYAHEMFLNKHLFTSHLPEEYPATCPHCSTSFDTQEEYKQHFQEPCFYKVYCSICKLYFATLNEFQKHSKIHDDIPSSTSRISSTQATPAAPEAEGTGTGTPPGRRLNDLVLLTRTTKCKLCGKQYSNFHNLLRHVRINHKNRLIDCIFCTKKFVLHEDFRKHTLKEHKSLVKATKNGEVYSCEKCDVGSATMEEWCDHQLTHTPFNGFPCAECDQTLDTERDLEEHKNMHANLKLKLYRCSDSNSYKTTSDYSLQSYNYNFLCEPCDKYFENEEDYDNHKAMHSNEMQESSTDEDVKPEDMNKRFSCPFCKKSYSCYSSMWKHKKKHHNKNSRKFLGLVSAKHFGKKRICPICYKVVPTSKSLWYHKKKAHGLKPKPKPVPQIPDNEPETYTDEIEDSDESSPTMEKNRCDVCNKKFRTLKGLAIHARLHVQPQVKTEEVKYKCDSCPKEFLSPEVLENHIKCHSDKPTFVCPVCQKHFMNNAGLASHVRIHSSKPPTSAPPPPVIKTENGDFKCSVCSMILSKRSALSNHVKVHLRNNTYGCPLCPRKFAGPATLNNHMKYVHAGENGLANNSTESEAGTASSTERFACTICDRSFLREGLLKTHLKAHEVSHSKSRMMPKKYKCSECKKNLPSAQALLRHQEREHDAQLTCNECNKKFVSAGALASHKGWHLRTNSALSNSNVCTACDMVFDSKQDFLAHLQSHKQKLHCQYCGRNFFNLGALKKHITIIHGNESVKMKKKFTHHTEYNSQSSERTYKCTECNAQFLTAKKLRLHVSIHSSSV